MTTPKTAWASSASAALLAPHQPHPPGRVHTATRLDDKRWDRPTRRLYDCLDRVSWRSRWDWHSLLLSRVFTLPVHFFSFKVYYRAICHLRLFYAFYGTLPFSTEKPNTLHDYHQHNRVSECRRHDETNENDRQRIYQNEMMILGGRHSYMGLLSVLRRCIHDYDRAC